MNRADYMEGRVSHRAYYAEICRIAGVRFSPDSPIARRAAASRDANYNDIWLSTWDRMGANAAPALARAFKECGDSDTMAGRVCAMKEAVRQAVEHSSSTRGGGS